MSQSTMIDPADYEDRAAFVAAAVAGFFAYFKPKPAPRPKRKRKPPVKRKPRAKQAPPPKPSAPVLAGVVGWPDTDYKIGTYNARVLTLIRDRGPMTIEEVAALPELADLKRSQIKAAISKCRSHGFLSGEHENSSIPTIYSARRYGDPLPRLTAQATIDLFLLIADRGTFGISMVDAARELGTNRNSMTTMGDPLRHRKWIVGDNGRPARYRLTIEGRAVIGDYAKL